MSKKKQQVKLKGWKVDVTEQPLLGHHYASGTVIDFMASMKPSNSSISEQFFNVADGLTSKFFSSFQRSDLLVIVLDRYNINYPWDEQR